jgi:hypothetical protein
MDTEPLDMLHAYFDESRTNPEDPFPVVAGFVSQTERWKQFEQQWNGILTKFGVLGFHMREFAHSRGEFRSWKGDANRRAAFMDALIAAIEQHVEYTWSVNVDEPCFSGLSCSSSQIKWSCAANRPGSVG